MLSFLILSVVQLFLLVLYPFVCFSVLLEISRLLNTGLDMESLSICVRLCEQGINPEALSSVIKELRRATDTLKVTKIIFHLVLNKVLETTRLMYLVFNEFKHTPVNSVPVLILRTEWFQ